MNTDKDREQLKKVMEKNGITWRSWWDGGSTSGPIATKWNVTSWPTLYVLDPQGVIRYKHAGPAVNASAIEEAIDKLLK